MDIYGKPVEGAELAVVVVDEAILALTNYQMADPMSLFYSNRPSYVDSVYSRASIILVDPLSFDRGEAAGSGAMDSAVQEKWLCQRKRLRHDGDSGAKPAGRGTACRPADQRAHNFNPWRCLCHR
jgi:hypothetical protein